MDTVIPVIHRQPILQSYDTPRAIRIHNQSTMINVSENIQKQDYCNILKMIRNCSF